MNSLQQQARFDDFVREFNHERPHEALGHEDAGRTLLSLDHDPIEACLT